MDYQGTIATPRADLGVALDEFSAEQSQLIGTKALPIFRSQEQAGTFDAVTRESQTMTPDTKRNSDGQYNRVSTGVAPKTFSCVENGLEEPLDDRKRKLHASSFDAELACTKTIMRALLLKQEIRIKNLLLNTTTFTGSPLFTDNSSAPWATVSTDIIGQVQAAIELVRANCGVEGNAVIMGKKLLNACKKNTAIRDAIKYNDRLDDAVVREALAGLFGVKKILAGGAIQNTADEGQTFAGGDVWGDTYAMVAVVSDETTDLAEPQIGRTFLWTEDSAENCTVEEYREERSRGAVYRVRQDTDENLIDAYFGHLMQVKA